MRESYLERRGCLMNNLTLPSFFQSADSRNIGHSLMEYLTLQKVFLQDQLSRNTRESEGPCSSAGVQGAGPLASAERAASPSAEGWREFQREEGNASQCMVPFLSLRISKLLLRSRLATLEPRFVHSRLPHPTDHQRSQG